VAFTATTRGSSAFDSYTAAISLTNALLAELVRTMGDAARRRCERMERVYSHFDVWSRQNPSKRKFT
jgi:DNA-binding MurR/RpiR family transcriptional regulator